MGREVKLDFIGVLVIFIVVLAFYGLGFILLSGFARGVQGAVEESVVERQLIARVKGSIYSSGEAVSVFGTCIDANDIPVENATGTFSAWYPNGTQFVFSENMTKLQEGYFLYASTMSVVQGTYLTEFVCQADINGVNQIAKAWGEWQNPFWVNMISNLSDQLSEGFNATIANITFLVENMTSNFNYTNQLILDTQIIANVSVDRSDSLLATLLYYLVNWTDYAHPFCGNLTVDEYYVGVPAYWSEWMIKVKAYSNGGLISSPDIACVINTTGTATPVYMDVQGNHFEFSEFVITLPGDDFSWTVNCFCV